MTKKLVCERLCLKFFSAVAKYRIKLLNNAYPYIADVIAQVELMYNALRNELTSYHVFKMFLNSVFSRYLAKSPRF